MRLHRRDASYVLALTLETVVLLGAQTVVDLINRAQDAHLRYRKFATTRVHFCYHNGKLKGEAAR